MPCRKVSIRMFFVVIRESTMTSKPLHPFSYLTFTLDASRQRSTPSCIHIYASLRKLLIISVQSKSQRDATGFDFP